MLHVVWMVAPAMYAHATDVPIVLPAAVLGMLSLWGGAWLSLLKANDGQNMGFRFHFKSM
jgi:hypothetical protein